MNTKELEELVIKLYRRLGYGFCVGHYNDDVGDIYELHHKYNRLIEYLDVEENYIEPVDGYTKLVKKKTK
jgi:hypothetical protein